MTEDEIETREHIEQAAWNLSVAFLQEMSEHLYKASRWHLIGKLRQCLAEMREVKMLIFADLSKDELRNLTLLEGKITSSSTSKDMNIHLYQYRETIMTLLAKYGYSIGKKADITKAILKM